jgi:hypothetical protein
VEWTIRIDARRHRLFGVTRGNYVSADRHTSCSHIGTMEKGTMPRLPVLAAAFLLVGLTAGCSGAPKDDAPDYEVDTSGKHNGGGSTGQEAPAPTVTNNPAPDQNVKSAETGTGAPAPTTVTASLDGQELTVVSTTIWAGVSKPGMYDVFVKVTGTGVLDGSDILISATDTKSGCQNETNYIVFRPMGQMQYMPKTATEPQCSLDVTELPAAVGGRFTATFDSTLYGINDPSQKTTKKLKISVDALRDK